MPELPEVETTVRGLKSKVLKRTFVDVWSNWEKIVKKPKPFSLFSKEIKGKKILNIQRRAKNIILKLSDNYSLLIHQKMTGHLLYGKWELENKKWVPEKGPMSEKINTFLHVIFFLDNKKMIALSDVRKFAKIELWKTNELLNSKEFKSLGPEPLEVSFTFKKFKEVLKDKKGNIKQVLMNPKIIAGIGNIYSSEVLWQAKVHPQKNVQDLKEQEFKNIYQAIKKVLTIAVKLGGESFSNYRKPDGTKGGFDTERRVYKREKEKCRRCKTQIVRIKFGQRSAFFCPYCQQL